MEQWSKKYLQGIDEGAAWGWDESTDETNTSLDISALPSLVGQGFAIVEEFQFRMDEMQKELASIELDFSERAKTKLEILELKGQKLDRREEEAKQRETELKKDQRKMDQVLSQKKIVNDMINARKADLDEKDKEFEMFEAENERLAKEIEEKEKLVQSKEEELAKKKADYAKFIADVQKAHDNCMAELRAKKKQLDQIKANADQAVRKIVDAFKNSESLISFQAKVDLIDQVLLQMFQIDRVVSQQHLAKK